MGCRRDYVSTRAARTDPWIAPVMVALDLNIPEVDALPGLVRSRTCPQRNEELYMATR